MHVYRPCALTPAASIIYSLCFPLESFLDRLVVICPFSLGPSMSQYFSQFDPGDTTTVRGMPRELFSKRQRSKPQLSG
jgi:hypothetical protein